MKEKLFITSKCTIEDFQVLVNGNPDFANSDTNDLTLFLKSIYKHYQVNYPKFYKMDNLSKLAFIAAEILLKDKELDSRYKPEDVAVMLQNASATLNTDNDYYNTIKDEANYFPSPALFVYTLANIMTGEICIRHKLMGENTTTINPTFNKQLAFNNISYLFENNLAQACIAGWVELDISGTAYNAQLYLIEREDLSNRNIIFGIDF